MLGFDSRLNLGAFYIAGQVSFGQNWNNANWVSSAVTATASSSASLDGTDDVNDAKTWMGGLVVGCKLSETLKPVPWHMGTRRKTPPESSRCPW